MNTQAKFDSFHQANLRVMLAIFFGLALFFLSRVAMLVHFGDLDEIYNNFGFDVLEAFWVGLKFDAKTLASLMVPLYFAFLVFALIPGRKFYRGVLLRLTPLYGFLVVAFCLWLMVINHFYYATFQSSIDVRVFGLIEDDTRAVMISVWKDYPVVTGFVIFLGICFLLARVLFRKSTESLGSNLGLIRQPIWFKIVYILGLAVALGIVVRGSLGGFPLGTRDRDISNSAFVNELVLNGPYALFEALDKRKHNPLSADFGAILKNNGFSSVEEAYQAYFGVAKDRVTLGDLFAQTPENDILKEKPPHVVFSLQEGMSGHLALTHSSQNDMLGSLADNVEDDIFFKRFLPDRDGTHPSLEGLLLNTPVSRISLSPSQFVSYRTSVAKPFRDAGYKTVYLYGGSNGWYNMHRFVPRQGFDEMYSADDIWAEYPNAKDDGAWGPHDEFLFKFALKLLAEGEAAGTPLFIFILTTSNHTPFNEFDGYTPASVDFSQFPEGTFLEKDRNAELMLQWNQYANDALGQFATQVKKASFGSKTIIGASGDHNLRALFNYPSNEDLFIKAAVPFYLYVPEDYLRGAKVDAKRSGSHKDIFPTIVNRALSKASYLNLGNDLLSSQLDEIEYFGTHSGNRLVTHKDGVITNGNSPQYFSWGEDGIGLIPNSEPPDSLINLSQKAKAMNVLQHWHMREQAKLLQK